MESASCLCFLHMTAAWSILMAHLLRNSFTLPPRDGKIETNMWGSINLWLKRNSPVCVTTEMTGRNCRLRRKMFSSTLILRDTELSDDYMDLHDENRLQCHDPCSSHFSGHHVLYRPMASQLDSVQSGCMSLCSFSACQRIKNHD